MTKRQGYMMTKSTTQLCIVLLAAMTLMLAGCSSADNGNADGANQEQATVENTDSTASDSNDVAKTPDVATETTEHTTTAAQVCGNCGTISAIIPVQTQSGPPEIVGTIIGGVAGAAIGSQIGSGSGKTIATIVGAIGGAIAGHKVQKRMTGQTLYKVRVRMDAGGMRTIAVPSAKRISTGMRVRVRNGNIVLM